MLLTAPKKQAGFFFQSNVIILKEFMFSVNEDFDFRSFKYSTWKLNNILLFMLCFVQKFNGVFEEIDFQSR